MTDKAFDDSGFRPFAPEEWRQIPGWPAYEVSSWGQVRSYWARLSGGDRIVWGIGTIPKILPPNISDRGRYNYILTSGKGNPRFSGQVAIFVLLAFVGPPEPGQEARHYYDHDPSNNHLWNLKWGSRHSNMQDIRRHTGKCSAAKLMPDQVREIRALRRGGMQLKDLATKFKIGMATVSNLINGKSYGYILDEPEGAEESKVSMVSAV